MSDFERFMKHGRDQDLFNIPGGLAGGVTPVPIPNTEVKPSKADDTAAARQWESRTLPGFKRPADRKVSGLFILKRKRAGSFGTGCSSTTTSGCIKRLGIEARSNTAPNK